MERDDVQACIDAELELLRPEVRRDSDVVAALLAEDFTEIGRSGRRWTRTEMLAAIGQFDSSRDDGEIPVVSIDGRVVAPGVVLVEYRTNEADGARTRRTSVWRCEDSGWRLVHHQGTPV